MRTKHSHNDVCKVSLLRNLFLGHMGYEFTSWWDILKMFTKIMGFMSVLFHDAFFDHVLEIFWSKKCAVLLNCMSRNAIEFLFSSLWVNFNDGWMLFISSSFSVIASLKISSMYLVLIQKTNIDDVRLVIKFWFSSLRSWRVFYIFFDL